MDVLARFPRVGCPTCNKTQPMIFDVMKPNDKNDHDAADMSATNESQSSQRCTERAPTGLACAPTRPRKHGHRTGHRSTSAGNSAQATYALATKGPTGPTPPR